MDLNRFLRLFVLTIAISLACERLHAQTTFHLKIKLVSDTDSQVVPFAKFSLLGPNKKPIVLSTTNQEGMGEVPIADTLDGKITIHVKTFGFAEYSSNLISFKTALPIEIRLKKQLQQLREVLIAQKRVEVDGEKLIYRVKQDQFSAGTSTAELLPNLPGVSFSAVSGLKLNGKSGVLILIDGNGEQRGQAQQLALLSNISSDQIERIEIISTPSAKYDASVIAVINVITKKTKGFSNLRGSYSQPLFMDGSNIGFDHLSGGGGTNLNFAIGKIRSALFLNINNSTGLDRTIDSRSVVGLWNYQADNFVDKSGFGISPTINFDYDINKRSSINVNVDVGISPSNITDTRSNYQFYNYATNSLDSTTRSNNLNTRKSTGVNTSASYRYRIDSLKNSFLYINAIYAGSQYSQFNELDEGKNGAPELPVLFNNYDGNGHSFSESIIFSNLLKSKVLSTDFGFKSNTFINHTNQSINAENTSFEYDEQLSAVFLSTRWKAGSYTITAELRSEWLNSTRRFQSTVEQKISDGYTKLYPNIFVQKGVNNDLTLNVSYSERVKRPAAAYLNPSQTINGLYSRTEGNIDFQPGYIDRFEGQMRYKTFGATAYFQTTTNESVTVPTGNQVIFQNSNLGKFSEYGLSLNKSFEAGKWFSSNNNVNLSRSSTGDEQNSYSRNSWSNLSVSTSDDFTISKKSRIHASVFYNSKSYYPYGYFLSDFVSSSIGLKQLLFKDKLTVDFGLNDPLGVVKLSANNDYPLQSSSLKHLTNSRTFSIQMVYKFRFGRNFNNQTYKNKLDGEIRTN